MATIAIIDDDIYIGDMLAELLQKNGYAVLRAYSGTEALYLLEHERPDLVLLDLMLPGLSGEEVLPHLDGVPVIILSAKSETKGKIDLLLAGAADYITKPFDNGELLARIAVQLRQKLARAGAVLTVGALQLDTAAHSVNAGGHAGASDENRVRDPQAPDAASRPGAGKIHDPRAHQSGHAGLHRSKPEAARFQPAQKAARCQR